jgi:hypothetical protein
MDSGLEIFWHTIPEVKKKQYRLAYPITIACSDLYARHDIFFLELYTDFFTYFSLCSSKCSFSSLDFSSWETPVVWPVSRFFTSFYEEEM